MRYVKIKAIMKSKKSILFFEFSILFTAILMGITGCSTKDKKADSDSDLTLRAQSEKRFKEIEWTDPIEKDRLTQNISESPKIAKTIKLTPVIFLCGDYAKNIEPVYPNLDGFGSLDTSGIPDEIKLSVTSFSENLCTLSANDELMMAGSVYELALFESDLKNEWKKVFLEDFPSAPEDKKTKEGESKDKEAQKEGEDQEPLEPEKPKFVFDSYIIGNGFEQNSLYELPVRFNCSKGFVDVMLYYYRESVNWKINQIKILRMEGKHE